MIVRNYSSQAVLLSPFSATVIRLSSFLAEGRESSGLPAGFPGGLPVGAFCKTNFGAAIAKVLPI
jgi:hypothetical protein